MNDSDDKLWFNNKDSLKPSQIPINYGISDDEVVVRWGDDAVHVGGIEHPADLETALEAISKILCRRHK